MKLVALRIERETEKVKGFQKTEKHTEEEFDKAMNDYNKKDRKDYYKRITDAHLIQALYLHDMGDLGQMSSDIEDSLDSAESQINEATDAIESLKEIIEAEKLEDIIKASSVDALHEVAELFVKKCDKDAILDKMSNEDIAKYFQEYHNTGEK